MIVIVKLRALEAAGFTVTRLPNLIASVSRNHTAFAIGSYDADNFTYRSTPTVAQLFVDALVANNVQHEVI